MIFGKFSKKIVISGDGTDSFAGKTEHFSHTAGWDTIPEVLGSHPVSKLTWSVSNLLPSHKP